MPGRSLLGCRRLLQQRRLASGAAAGAADVGHAGDRPAPVAGQIVGGATTGSPVATGLGPRSCIAALGRAFSGCRSSNLTQGRAGLRCLGVGRGTTSLAALPSPKPPGG